MTNWYYLLILLLLCIAKICTPSLVIVANKSDSLTTDEDNAPSFPALNLTTAEKDRLQRIQESRFGTKHILVVRVSSSSSWNGDSPLESLDEIEAAVYGTGPNPLQVPANSSLVAQFRAVSHGRLIYEPLVVPNLTRPGLLDMVIAEHMSNVTRFDTIVRPAMMEEVTRILGASIFSTAHRILFCLPSGSLDPTVAGIGEVGGMFTFYHLGYCRKLDALMHELGHNLNFHHSGIGALEYGDMTDYMGGLEASKSSKKKSLFGLRKDDPNSISSPINGAGYPRKAFNGHKHWNSGWFQDRASDVHPFPSDGIIQKRIVSFVEYSNPTLLSDDLVLLKCGNLFIQYNRAKGYNIDTSERDRVTISEGLVDGALSKRVASLSAGERYQYPNFDSSGRDLVVQVCGMTKEVPGVIDFADVRVYIDDGSLAVVCPEMTGTNLWNTDTFLSGIFQVEEPFRSVFSIALFTFIVFMSTLMSICCCCCIYNCVADRKAGDNKDPKANVDDSYETDIDETIVDMEAIPL